MSSKNTLTIPLTDDLKEEVQQLAEKLNISKALVGRVALILGMKALRSTADALKTVQETIPPIYPGQKLEPKGNDPLTTPTEGTVVAVGPGRTLQDVFDDLLKQV